MEYIIYKKGYILSVKLRKENNCDVYYSLTEDFIPLRY